MAYADWPTTNVSPACCSETVCNPCDPGHGYLIGPLREVEASHVFNVRKAPVAVKALGLGPFKDAEVCVQIECRVCGETVFEDLRINGYRVCLDACNNVLTLTGTGRYRVVLTGAPPGDIVVTQAETYPAGGIGINTATVRTITETRCDPICASASCDSPDSDGFVELRQ